MSDGEQTQPTKSTTNMPVGEILRRTRLHYKQTIPDIERAIRIRASQIEAIESGDLSSLPGRVYAIGFVRSYSEFLGLDGDKMVDLFKKQSGGKTATPELNFPTAPNDTKLPSKKLVMACLAGIVLAIGLWAAQSDGGKETVNEIPAVETVRPAPVAPAEQQQAAAPAAPQAPVGPEPQVTTEQGTVSADATTQTVAADETLAAKPKDGIILNILENSWVEIKDQSGKSMISRVLQAGDQYFVPDRPDLAISIGNAGGVEFEVDGQKLKPVGKLGEVRRSLPLDAEYLKKNFALN
jgi:cytoskeleton protein RodZ